jgi:hypothetical protein
LVMFVHVGAQLRGPACACLLPAPAIGTLPLLLFA